MQRPTKHHSRIAIIGIGCRLPGGVRDVAGYWDLLQRGRCAIREIPAERWSLEGFYDPAPDMPHRSYSKWGGFLDDVRGFDPAFFGLTPREAEGMDPQQRLLLMTAVEAAADARMSLATLRRSVTGVFIGVSNIDYGLLQRYRSGHGELQAGTGTALSIVANRVSNRLDLTGPSMGIDTACSSALVAVDAACRNLADGSCDLALAGGVNVLLDPRMFITFCRAHMLSATGRIRAFDARADGFVRGEGVGVVLLRRFEDALEAGDRIYAVIEATAVNQDGRTGTITEPNETAQIAMLSRALARAGIAPGDIGYVEAHGTGTPVGDPIEARAIGKVLGLDRATPLPIGSVKTNIGHLEPAAGVAGLIKTALALSYGTIPPSLGFERANPAIDLDRLGLRVATAAAPLEGTHALVNSFGFGGTNACAVLADVGWVKRSATQQFRSANAAAGSRLRLDPAYDDPLLFPISGPTIQHVEAFAARLLRAMDDGTFATASIREIGAALASQRDHAEHRTVIIARDLQELREGLECVASAREWPAVDRHAAPQIVRGRSSSRPRLAMTMTGQGGQTWDMGRELYAREPVFRRVFEAFDDVFRPIAGWSVIGELLADEATSRIDDAAITPAVMFAFQTGLAEVWRARGVTPDIVLGHSFGEVTAAYLAGGIGLTDVARLVTHRGLIRGKVDRRGTMAAIGLGADAIAGLLPADGSIEIGGFNSPSMVTLTGEEAAIDALIARLNAEDPAILTRKLALDFAYHSSWFAPVEEIFKSDVGRLETSAPRLPVISTVTGNLNDDFSADYWWRNLRRPVLYQQGVETALEMGADVFLELGPHRTLSSMTAACAAAKGCEVATVTTLDRRWGDLASLAVASAQLHVAGVPIDWAALLGGDGRNLALPAQPWLTREIWSEPEEAARHLRPAAVHPLLGRPIDASHATWQAEISLASHPWLSDHRLDGTCVMPAAAYLEMMIAVAREVLARDEVELRDVELPAALYLGSDDDLLLETRHDQVSGRINVHSRSRGSQAWDLRATAVAFVFDGEAKPVAAPPTDQPLKQLSASEFYRDAGLAGFGWGRSFQGLKDIVASGAHAIGHIEIDTTTSGMAFDASVVDSALQLMLTGQNLRDSRRLPVSIARVIARGAISGQATARHWLDRFSAGDETSTISIRDAQGRGDLLVDGICTKPWRATPERRADDERAPRFCIERWQRADLATSDGSASGRWIVIGQDSCGEAPKLVDVMARHGLVADVMAWPSRHCGAREKLVEALQRQLSGGPVAGIIAAFQLDDEAADAGDITELAVRSSCELVELAKVLGEITADRETGLQLVVLTSRARSVGQDDSPCDRGLARGANAGFLRTLATEAPALNIRAIDVGAGSRVELDTLCTALASATRETELAIRGDVVLVPRLVEQARDALLLRQIDARNLGRATNYALRKHNGVGADALGWREVEPVRPGPGEVLIETRAVGLNFRDVMAVADLLPPAAEPLPAIETLGLELAGVVQAVGAGIDDLAPGTPVIGMAIGALQRFVVWPRALLHPLPKGLDSFDAVTLPSAFLTAHYALNEIGRLQQGETILIHSATGGVGLAAIAIARSGGARIIATAGSEEKRAHLRCLGIAHVFDSRSLAFADGVLEATGGRGADVVLNSLGGAVMQKSLAVLAPYGRFLELGKRDIYAGGMLPLKAMRANASFHVIDLAALIRERPAHAARLLGDVMAMLSSGEIAPLPKTVFPAHKADEAFKAFSAARHIGKLVIDMADPGIEVERARDVRNLIDGNGTYLVTGGSRGFGRRVAEWLVANGAGRVIAISRGTADEDPGTAIRSLQLDVTDAAAVDRIMAQLADDAPPLRGIIHAAVVYDDALVADMTGQQMRKVMAPKVAGAINLTRAVERHAIALDFMLSFSSLAGVVGWPGQANYAAANAFLERLVHWQRARGIPAQCINWGALGESGHVARNSQMLTYLESSGWIAMSDEAALAALGDVLTSSEAIVTIAAAEWSRLAASHPTLATSPRTAALVASGATAGSSTGAGIAALDGERLAAAAAALVRREAAKVLRIDAGDLERASRLDEAGIDSLSSFELRNRLSQSLGHDVPLPRYAKARTFDALSALVAALVVEARESAK